MTMLPSIWIVWSCMRVCVLRNVRRIEPDYHISRHRPGLKLGGVKMSGFAHEGCGGRLTSARKQNLSKARLGHRGDKQRKQPL